VNWSRLYINKLRKNDFNPIINGQEVAMLRDTGCTKTLVHSSLVPNFSSYTMASSRREYTVVFE
jgi:predicted aspartyl protease